MGMLSVNPLWIAAVALSIFGECAAGAAPVSHSSLVLEQAIRLEGVQGRIDHIAVDVERQRLFVAELQNGSLDILDVSSHSSIKRIAGLHEPQGLAYSKRTQTLYVASGGDGVLHAYSGSMLETEKSIRVGADADNVRIDDAAARIYVGVEAGIVVVDEARFAVIAKIKLRAHPESFQLHRSADRIYANVPGAKEIAVIDSRLLQQSASWQTDEMSANFPMTLDGLGGKLFIAFRQPTRLAVYDTAGGTLLQSLNLCGDADDLFFDEKRSRIYASCGEGFVDVFAVGENSVTQRERVTTKVGARTSFFVAEWNRLFVAARAAQGRSAEVLIYAVAG